MKKENITHRWLLFLTFVVIGVVVFTAVEIHSLRQQVRLLGTNTDVSPMKLEALPAAELSREMSMPIVAVSNSGEGSMGVLTMKVVPGKNNVLISTNPFLEPDLQYSVNTAVSYAKLMTKKGYDRDYILEYTAGQAQLIGGGSAGAATAILAIGLLEGKVLKNDTIITGTVFADGSIGEVGGILEKVKAAADAGYKTFLVPMGQSEIIYYEKVTTDRPYHGFVFHQTRYVPRQIDLKEEAKKEWGIAVVEVGKIREALPYFFDNI